VSTTVYEAAFAGIELGLSDFVDVTVLAALPNQDVDAAGDLIDTVDVTWALTGRPGTFTNSVPFEADWPDLAIAAILRNAELVKLIYEGASSGGEWVDVAAGTPGPPSAPPPPSPGGPVPL
jgi:hypothetical protein